MYKTTDIFNLIYLYGMFHSKIIQSIFFQRIVLESMWQEIFDFLYKKIMK